MTLYENKYEQGIAQTWNWVTFCDPAILGFFENRKNSGLTPGHNDDPVIRK